MVTCLFDSTEHEDQIALHKHLKKKKIKQEDYYVGYFNKKDLLTGEAIQYKNPEQYLASDFLNKENLMNWMQANPQKGLEWAKNWLIKRKISKGLVYAPSQAELRSLVCPTMHFYERNGGYYKICESVGLKNKYAHETLTFKELPKNTSIISDTREQKPFKLAMKTKKKKLDVADYGLSGASDKGIYIERKSGADMIGTLSKDTSVDRFRRELIRARDQDFYVIMLVESSMEEMLEFNNLPQYQWAKVKPAHVFKNLRDLLVEFKNFQVVFAQSKIAAAVLVIKLFKLGEQVKNIDLQWKLEKGEL